jgi:hypothetical protein
VAKFLKLRSDKEEVHSAFDWDVDTFIYYGGHPGSAELIEDRLRWANYIKDSLIETTISRDFKIFR